MPLGSNATLVDRNYCCDGKEKGRCCTDPANHFHLDGDGTVAFKDGAKARFQLNTDSLKTFATLAGASRSFEITSESDGPSPAFSTIDVTITSADLSSPTFSLDTPLSSSQSEAGPFSTSTTTFGITEAESNQADPSNIDLGTIIGATVGGSIGTITVLLGILYFFHRRASRKQYERRSSEGRPSTDKSLLRVTPDSNDSPPNARDDADQTLVRVTKDQIGLPTLVVDESSLPADFRRKSHDMAAEIGLAITMNSPKHLSNGFAQPDSPVSPIRMHGKSLSICLPPRAKIKPNYYSIPSTPTSPSVVSPSNQYTDQPVLPTESPEIRSPSPPRLSLHPLNTPLPPKVKVAESFQSSLLRSSTFFRSHHHKPLKSNPLGEGSIELFDIQPDHDDHLSE